jgi:hypothetical protein
MQATMRKLRKEYIGTRATSQPRAKTGGEYGPNGEWYNGGAFIATSEMPKRERHKAAQAATRKVQVRPYVWVVPEPHQIPIHPFIWSGSVLNEYTGELNHTYIEYAGLTQEDIGEIMHFYEIYKTGQNFVSVEDYPHKAGFDTAARYIITGTPISRDVLNRMQGVCREMLEKYGEVID